MADHILELSTEVEPAKTFTVDDEEYKLLGLEHLSDEDEAKATAAFTRFGQLLNALDRANSDQQATRLSKQLRERRIELITMLTTIPKDVASRLPLSAQVKLFRAVQQETGNEELGVGEGGFE